MPIILAIVVIIVGVIIGGNAIDKQLQERQQASQLTPTPTYEKVLDDFQDNSQPKSENSFPTTPPPQRVQGAKVQPTIALPTTDPDPLITCNSKTGKITVRLSVCKSYTDCPDGYGGFVFESQESCKARWNKISKDAENAAKAYGNSLVEQQKLFHQQLNSQNQNPTPIPDYTTNLPQPNYDSKIDFKIIEATPTPCPQGWYGAEIDVEGPCGN